MAETILEQQMRRTEGQEFFSSEDIVGKKVKNPEGYDLGEISSLRVGLPTGRVAYAVLKTGGMFGLGAKHFAIPIEAMIYRPGDDVFVVNVSKHRLDNEPGFSEGDWPREANWSLIESRRPMGPPSQEEARAVTRTEPPPREVVTTERVEVRERAPREEMPIRAEEVEATRARTAVPVTETAPVTETHASTLESTMKPGDVEEGRAMTVEPATGRLSAADLQVYLKGMDYPAGRADLVTHARQHGAPQSVLTTLEGFPDRTYRSAADVSAEFGGEARTRQPTGIETPSGARHLSLAHLSAADLQVYLKGMDYPAGRESLITQARKNGAPEDVIAALEQFEEREYRSAADVSTEFGKIR
ncbi:MAG: hypothetical protein PWQ30_1733 [Euryarchaeota archaeon]|nr:hypothetical protein [Euryarchaeota archaeon]